MLISDLDIGSLQPLASSKHHRGQQKATKWLTNFISSSIYTECICSLLAALSKPFTFSHSIHHCPVISSLHAPGLSFFSHYILSLTPPLCPLISSFLAPVFSFFSQYILSRTPPISPFISVLRTPVLLSSHSFLSCHYCPTISSQLSQVKHCER